MWAQDVVTLDFTDNTDWEFPTSKVVTENSYTDGQGYTIKLEGAGSKNGYRWYSDNKYLINGKSGATLTLPAFDFDVQAIQVVGRSGASGAVGQNIYVGETAVSTETTGATGTNLYYINPSYQAAGNVYKIKVTTEHNTQFTKILIWKKASISAVGWSTYSRPYPLDFTSVTTANAYMVTGATGSALELTQVTGTVPENTGLLISGSGSVDIPTVASSSTSTSDNLLVKGDGASVKSNGHYVLVARESKAVFAPTGDNAATVPVGKAYLDLSGISARDFYFLDDSETTGIKSVSSEAKGFFEGEFYNLSGQRVTKPTKGLYIVNGKKVIIK